MKAWLAARQNQLCSHWDVQQRFGPLRLHVVSVQRNVLDPAALGKEQVCSRRNGLDVRPRRRTHGRWHHGVFDT